MELKFRKEEYMFTTIKEGLEVYRKTLKGVILAFKKENDRPEAFLSKLLGMEEALGITEEEKKKIREEVCKEIIKGG